MKKKYTTPEIEIVKINSKDVIQTSGLETVDMPNTLDLTATGAEQLKSVNFVDIFE